MSFTFGNAKNSRERSNCHTICGLRGQCHNDTPYNPTGSMQAIEGITSPDSRIFGKMGHAERIGPNLYKNLGGEFDMKIFESGIMYFQ